MKNRIVSFCIERGIFSDWAWLQVFKDLHREVTHNPGVWTCVFVLYNYNRFVRDAYRRQVNYWCFMTSGKSVSKSTLPFNVLARDSRGYESPFDVEMYREECTLYYLDFYKSKVGK